MPFSPKMLEEKPYNKCIICLHIGVRCDGPNFLAMTMERWCEWCKLRKEYLGWTNADLVEKSGVAKTSIERILSKNCTDLKVSTMQMVTKALVNGSWGQYPCAMADDPNDPAMVMECQRLQEKLEDSNKKVDFLKEQVKFKENQMLQKDKLLEERADYLRTKDKYIARLATALIVSLAVIIVALIADRLNPSIGFFWRDTISQVLSVL